MSLQPQTATATVQPKASTATCYQGVNLRIRTSSISRVCFSYDVRSRDSLVCHGDTDTPSRLHWSEPSISIAARSLRATNTAPSQFVVMRHFLCFSEAEAFALGQSVSGEAFALEQHEQSIHRCRAVHGHCNIRKMTRALYIREAIAILKHGFRSLRRAALSSDHCQLWSCESRS